MNYLQWTKRVTIAPSWRIILKRFAKILRVISIYVKGTNVFPHRSIFTQYNIMCINIVIKKEALTKYAVFWKSDMYQSFESTYDIYEWLIL